MVITCKSFREELVPVGRIPFPWRTGTRKYLVKVTHLSMVWGWDYSQSRRCCGEWLGIFIHDPESLARDSAPIHARCAWGLRARPVCKDTSGCGDAERSV